MLLVLGSVFGLIGFVQGWTTTLRLQRARGGPLYAVQPAPAAGEPGAGHRPAGQYRGARQPGPVQRADDHQLHWFFRARLLLAIALPALIFMALLWLIWNT